MRSQDGSLQDLSVVVDSGAAVTLIAERTWRGSQWSKKTLMVTNTRLHTASGEQLKVVGVAKVDVILGGKSVEIKAIVVADLAPAMLLGVDFLDQSGAVINFRKQTLTIPGLRDIAIQCGAPRLIRTAKQLEIAGRSKAVIPCRVESTDGSVILVEARAVNRHVHIARSIDRVQRGQILCTVVNTSTMPISLREDYYLSQWEELPTSSKIEGWKKKVTPVQPKVMVPWREEMGRADNSVYKDVDGTAKLLLDGMSHLSREQKLKLFKGLEPYKSIFVSGQNKMPTEARDQVISIRGGTLPQ